MTARRNIAVLDVGKTNAKMVLVDRETLREKAVLSKPNEVRTGPPWPHFDVEGVWDFALDALKSFHESSTVDGVAVTTHGATLALLDQNGALAAPILDYEHGAIDEIASSYNAIRPPFSETGSPRLPGGLNAGAQLHWQFTQDPELAGRVAQIVTYPQYWAFRLTGETACDLSSLGCHTDLWNPVAGTYSSLVDALGLRDKFAPPRRSSDVLGAILPRVAERTGLDPSTPVVCGIHDSNASLLPHLVSREAPFAVVSTGTWVVVMAIGGQGAALDPARDTLMNVSALGEPVPSARFMGGREFELIAGEYDQHLDSAAENQVLAAETMLLPAVVPESGPFRGQPARWHPSEPMADSAERQVAASYYLALMTSECLSLCGAAGDIVVEGPFAGNRPYLDMLANATGRRIVLSASATGTSIGAAMLFDSARPIEPKDILHEAVSSAAHVRYAKRWRDLAYSK